LLNSIPKLDQARRQRLPSIPGEVPELISLPAGCNFSPRCTHVFEKCLHDDPSLVEIAPGRKSACWKAGEFIE
jgi:peptide/nickel transport system ATP-binding protein